MMIGNEITVPVIFALLYMIVLGSICYLIGRHIRIKKVMKFRRIGTLKIDTTKEEVDKYSINIDVPLEDLPKNDYISLKVDVVEAGKAEVFPFDRSDRF